MPNPIVDSRALQHLQQRFNYTFTQEKLLNTPDGQGGFTRTWQTGATIPGALEALSAEERLARGLTEATGMFTAFVAYGAAVDVTQRLRLGTRVFEISNVNDLGQQHVILALDVKERRLP